LVVPQEATTVLLAFAVNPVLLPPQRVAFVGIGP
jgi:hypothetical protein